LDEEFNRICEWTEANVSDNSAWTFRAWAGRKLEKDVGGEIEVATRLINVYRGHETLWYFLSLLVWHNPSKMDEVILFAKDILDGLEIVNEKAVDDVKQQICSEKLVTRFSR
jgi:hypothetical protein